MKKNLLITSCSGFIGKHLLNSIEFLQLEDKYNIILLSSKKIKNYLFINHKNYSFSKQDFIEKGVENIDVVLHLGAFTPKSSKNKDNIMLSTSNIKNTIYLINNLPNTPEKFIFAST